MENLASFTQCLKYIREKCPRLKIFTMSSGHVKEQIFRIIDSEFYLEQINLLNSFLPEGLVLPPFDPFDLMNLAKIYSTTNRTHINLIVRIPIINSEYFELNELIPVPMSLDNKTIIIKLNSVYFIRDGANTVQLLPFEAFNNCYSFLNIIICNSFVGDAFYKPN